MGIATLFRIIGVLFGILAVLSLARSGLGIRFREEFLPAIEWIERSVPELLRPLEILVVQPVIQWLRAHDMIVELEGHWRQVFVLLWLFTSSYSGAFAPLGKTLLDVREAGTRWPQVSFTGLSWAASALIALGGGIAAGLLPLDASGVFWRPIIAFYAFISVRAFLAAVFQDQAHARPGMIGLVVAVALLCAHITGVDHVIPPGAFLWSAIAIQFAYSAALILGSAPKAVSTAGWGALVTTLAAAGASISLAAGVPSLPAWFAPQASPSPGLASLALFVCALSAIDLISAAYWNRHGQGAFLDRWLLSAKGSAALRILSVAGVSFLLVWFASLS